MLFDLNCTVEKGVTVYIWLLNNWRPLITVWSFKYLTVYGQYKFNAIKKPFQWFTYPYIVFEQKIKINMVDQPDLHIDQFSHLIKFIAFG